MFRRIGCVRSGIVFVVILAASEEGGVRGAEDAPRSPILLDVNGEEHRPLDTGANRASVIVFTTHDCPIANAYAPTLARLRREHADDPLAFYLVHVDPKLEPEEARAHATEYGLTEATILLDSGHELVRALRPLVTPEAFVILPDGAVAYRGRIDDLFHDLGRRRTARTTHELADAIDAVLAGRPVAVPRTEAVGCVVPPDPVASLKRKIGP